MAQSSTEWPGTADDGFAPGNDTVLQVFGKKDGIGRKCVRRIIQLRLSYKK